jgi:tetratricopeptide (TPR) repeat protein
MGRDEGGHITEALMERFLKGEAGEDEASFLVRHLLTRCPECLQVAAAIGGMEGFIEVPEGEARPAPVPEDADYKEVFLALLGSGDERQMRLAQEKLRAIGLFAALEELPPEKRLPAIKREKRFQTWGLFDRLLTKYLEYSRNRPQDGLRLACLALAVVETLDPDEYPPAVLADFRASALGALANARRLAADFDGARAALRTAWEKLQAGTGDPLAEAHLISLEASLLRDLGKLEESAAILADALEIYERLGDSSRQARTLIQQASALGYVEPALAVPLLQSALAILDAAEEPRLELCARHNLVWSLNASGRHQEALALLEISRHLYRAFADASTQLRLHWLEGLLARALGDLADAEATFRMVWYEFEARGMLYELTLVSIDLAEVYTLRRRFKRAAQLARDLQPVLQERGMHAEGLAVWSLFSKALAKQAREKRALDAPAFRQASRYYHRAWLSPVRETAVPAARNEPEV